MNRFAGAFLIAFILTAAGSAVAGSSEVAAMIPGVDARPATPSVEERLEIICEQFQAVLGY
jgi:hypothetical protein